MPATADIEQLRARLTGKGPRLWRSLEEVAGSDAFRRFVESEFPSAVSALNDAASRRTFLRMMGASLLLAGLPACDYAPAQDVVPWVERPEQTTPGRPSYYASAMPFGGYVQPVVAECHAGRPTRLDGNDRHPAASRALDPFTQAAVLQLYDPDRSHHVLADGKTASSWARARIAITAALDEVEPSGGEGLWLLTGDISSPTLLRQIAALKRRFPKMRHHVLEPAAPEAYRAATKLAYGQAAEVQWRLEQADVIIDLDADLLGPGPHQLSHARGWSTRRRNGQRTKALNRLFVAESSPSPTGAKATRRLRIASGRIPALTVALAAALDVETPGPELTEDEHDFIRHVATAIGEAPGRAVIAAGQDQPVWVQALVFALNERIGARGTMMIVTEPVLYVDAEPLAALQEDLVAGKVSTLLMIETNPAFTGFWLDLTRAKMRIHMGLYADETAVLCHWHLPLAHPLESWSDGRAVDGTPAITQPTIQPLYGGLSLHTVMDVLSGGVEREARAIVRETWADLDEAAWRRALEDGVVRNHDVETLDAPARMPDIPALGAPANPELVFRPDPSIWDGRFANLGWLQELPKPMTKLTWDNAALVSPAYAARLSLASGQMIEIACGTARVAIPIHILPGQADDTITLHFGHGRRQAGRIGTGTGFDVYPLRAQAGAAMIAPLATTVALATTQMHHSMEGLDLVRWIDAEEAAAPLNAELNTHGAASFFPNSEPTAAEAWGMSIDLDVCIGCNACVIGCQAENNIPTVGKDQVQIGREMHWIRIDRYFEGSLDAPDIHFQPVPCMHCEHAPCELGCPVNAAVHSPDGLNEQIYNRCIGTRTCSSYCPYKVRRFNFFDYSHPHDEADKAQHNPNVTVRARGVMEKCTYCVQRISAARKEAFVAGRPLADGDVVTACQAACPTEAIVFGDQKDGASAVNAAKREPRDYVLLEEVNTRPRTTYRARIRDPEDKA